MKKIIALATGLIMSAGIASAASLQNGSFEQGTNNSGSFRTLGVGATDMTGWAIEAGTLDWITGYWTHADGNRSLDMSGSNAAAVISQDITGLVIGQNYDVTFALAGNPAGGSSTKSLNVEVGNENADYTFSTTGKTTSNMGWVMQTFSFTADAVTEKLRFTSGNVSSWGPALDKVSVAPAAVPLPASVLLLGGALAGLTRLRKRG